MPAHYYFSFFGLLCTIPSFALQIPWSANFILFPPVSFLHFNAFTESIIMEFDLEILLSYIALFKRAKLI